MKWILFCVFFSFLGTYNTIQFVTNNNHVYFLTHQWCRKCDKMSKIFQKLKTNLGQKIKLEQRSNKESKEIYDKIHKKYNIEESQVPFPSIWIECSNYRGFYQNQLTYEEIYYWIGIYCQGIIPSCAEQNSRYMYNNQEDYLFRMSFQEFQNQKSSIITFQIQYPFVKFCQSKQNSQSIYAFHQLIDQIKQGPLFFSHFNHNLRNYLYNSSDKLAIFLFFNNPSHPKVKQLINIYKFISDSLQNNSNSHLNQGKISDIYEHNSSHQAQIQSQYHHSSLQNYDFQRKKQIYQNLAFVGACYNEKKRDCIMKYQYSIQTNKLSREKDPSQKPIFHNDKILFSFIGSKSKNLKRLFQFTHYKNIFENQDLKEDQIKHNLVQITAYHFNKQSHQIDAYLFENIGEKLGNNFLFWIQNTYQQIFQNEKQQITQKIHRESKCISSEIIHYFSERNLTAIKNNVKIRKFIQEMNSQLQQQKSIKFQTVIIQQQPQKMLPMTKINRKWKSQNFRVCISNQFPKILSSYTETLKILNSLKYSNLKVLSQQKANNSPLTDQL